MYDGFQSYEIVRAMKCILSSPSRLFHLKLGYISYKVYMIVTYVTL